MPGTMKLVPGGVAAETRQVMKNIKGVKDPRVPTLKGVEAMKVKANGIQINYEMLGQEGGPVVVLSHSLGAGLAMWDPQIEVLAAHYRVLRYDTRGHGRTDAPAEAYTFEMLGDDAIGLLDALGIDVVNWVGLSMGGMIGQCLAVNYPHRLRTLALCDTAAVLSDEFKQTFQERVETVRSKGMQALAQLTLERWFTPPYLQENPPVVEKIRRQFLATPVAGYIGCIEALRHLDYLERLPQIKTPTLIIVGKEDLGTPVAASEAMHDRIPDSRLVVLPSAAHFSNVEQAQAFNNALMGFLEEHLP
jgi:3-oxoadipate enol-lactonase